MEKPSFCNPNEVTDSRDRHGGQDTEVHTGRGRAHVQAMNAPHCWFLPDDHNVRSGTKALCLPGPPAACSFTHTGASSRYSYTDVMQDEAHATWDVPSQKCALSSNHTLGSHCQPHKGEVSQNHRWVLLTTLTWWLPRSPTKGGEFKVDDETRKRNALRNVFAPCLKEIDSKRYFWCKLVKFTLWPGFRGIRSYFFSFLSPQAWYLVSWMPWFPVM